MLDQLLKCFHIFRFHKGLNLCFFQMVMYRNDNDKIILSVCDPNLNISEKTYTTKEPSRIIKKQLELKGLWKPTKNSKQTEISYKANSTSLTVYCQHGQPVEITLINLPQ